MTLRQLAIELLKVHIPIEPNKITEKAIWDVEKLIKQYLKQRRKK